MQHSLLRSTMTSCPRCLHLSSSLTIISADTQRKDETLEHQCWLEDRYCKSISAVPTRAMHENNSAQQLESPSLLNIFLERDLTVALGDYDGLAISGGRTIAF
ncbi:hypothetical protein PoB_005261400 [Plakobranchus ocellatus]|uniref:Uncharacterized protein n=1 Tax=Plakobranchus ocellatus TaxID=259542 RepID=A0AAV4C4R8_9GAST|nr:hypothetical protein PoB_005261400 [Plakobranchus ocellatus]